MQFQHNILKPTSVNEWLYTSVISLTLFSKLTDKWKWWKHFIYASTHVYITTVANFNNEYQLRCWKSKFTLHMEVVSIVAHFYCILKC